MMGEKDTDKVIFIPYIKYSRGQNRVKQIMVFVWKKCHDAQNVWVCVCAHAYNVLAYTQLQESGTWNS